MVEKSVFTQNKTPFRRLTFGLVLGYVCMLIALMTPGIMLLPFKIMEIDPEGYTTSYGLITGISAIFGLISMPLGGAISDRTNIAFGRRRTWILIGSIGGCASLIGIALSTSLWLVLLAVCCTQLFFGFSMAAFNALIPDQVEEDKQGTISGFFGLGLPVAMIVGMGTLMAMGSASSLTKWLVVAIIGVVGAIISSFIIIDGKVEIQEKKVEKLTIKEKLNKVYPNPRKFPEFTWALLLKFLLMMGYFSILYLSIMLVDRMGMDQTEASNSVGMINMIGLAGAAFASVTAGAWSDKIKKQKPFLYGSAILIITGLLLFAYVPTLTGVIIAVAILGIGQGCFGAVDTALVARILPNKMDASKDFGLMNIANTLPQSLIPALAPVFLNIGGWNFFYLSLVVFVLLSMLTLRKLPEVGEKSSSDLNDKIAAYK